MTTRDPGRRRSRRGGRGRVPAEVPSGGQFGDRQALEQQIAAAPLNRGDRQAPVPAPAAPAAPGQPAVGGGPAGLPGQDLVQNANVFGTPTDRPNEPLNAGLGGPSALPSDPDVLLRAMFGRSRRSAILRLIRN